MQIEVTEKEARGIIYRREISKRFTEYWPAYIVPPAVGLGATLGLCIIFSEPGESYQRSLLYTLPFIAGFLITYIIFWLDDSRANKIVKAFIAERKVQ